MLYGCCSDVVCTTNIRRCRIPPVDSCKPGMAGTEKASDGRELAWRSSCQNCTQTKHSNVHVRNQFTKGKTNFCVKL